MNTLRQPRQLETSYASLSRKNALLVLAGTVCAINWCAFKSLDMSDTNLDTMLLANHDSYLYARISQQVYSGYDYYDAAGSELRSQGYPIDSVFNWRTPIYAWIFGRLPSPSWGWAILILCATIALAMTSSLAGREGGAGIESPRRIGFHRGIRMAPHARGNVLHGTLERVVYHNIALSFIHRTTTIWACRRGVRTTISRARLAILRDQYRLVLAGAKERIAVVGLDSCTLFVSILSACCDGQVLGNPFLSDTSDLGLDRIWRYTFRPCDLQNEFFCSRRSQHGALPSICRYPYWG